MSWLARSLASTLMPDRQDDEMEARKKAESTPPHPHAIAGEDGDPNRGVKQDLSDLTQALTRQFRGVASFLAPPPSSSAVGGAYDPAEGSNSPAAAGFRTDFAEIGGRFRSGISKLSSSKAVSEISKIASTFLPFGPREGEDEEEGCEGGLGRKYGASAGVTEEVMTFVRNISKHPETWLDFPLLPDDDESDDFDMSDVQQEHALAVEGLAPRLAALRMELCPSHMSEGCFWKIYFVLLHLRLNKHDAEMLSTPQIVEARVLLQKLQNQANTETERPGIDVSYRKVDDTSVRSEEQVTEPKDLYENSPSKGEESIISVPITDFMTDKHPVQTTEIEVIDKSVVEEEPPRQMQKDHSDVLKITIERFDEDGDDWLEEETGEIGTSGSTTIPLGDDEDVSFSDLEEEDDRSAPKAPKK